MLLLWWLALCAPAGDVAAQGSRPGDPTPASAPVVSQAAQSFARGQQLYQQGAYTEAIAAFERANQLAPHPSASFNIARCYENMGETAAALDHYRRALAASRDPVDTADIRRRIAQLEALPVKLFVNSEPGGASITVAGNAAPEPGQTPLVVRLRPGAYVLLAEKAGYQLAARRVEVRVGKLQPIEIRLEPRPADARCPVAVPRLVDLRSLHLHVGVLGGIGLTLGRPLLAAPGLRVYATYRGWLFGGHVLYFPVGEESISPITVRAETFDNARFRSVLAQGEGGWVLPLRNAQLELTAGIGLSTDRVIFAGSDHSGQLVREQSAFAWSLGSALQAMVNRWISVGVSARFGLIHGTRVDKDDPDRTDDQRHFPFATFWGTVALRL